MPDCTCADPQAVAQALTNDVAGAIKDQTDQIKKSVEYLDETLYGKNTKDEQAGAGAGGGGGGGTGRMAREDTGGGGR